MEYMQLEQPARLERPARYRLYLMLSSSLFWFSLYSYPAIMSPYLSELGASPASIGVVIGAYGLAQTLLRLPAGVLSDRLRNRKLFIIGGLFLCIVSAAGLFLSQSIGFILLFRAMSGAAAAVWVHITTLYFSYFTADQAAQAMGRLNFSTYLSQMSATLAGSLLAQFFGWKYAFLLALAVSIPGFIFSLKIFESTPPVDPVLAKIINPVLAKKADLGLAKTVDLVLAEKSDPALAADALHEEVSVRRLLSVGRDRILFWTSVLAMLCQLAIFATSQGFVPQFASQLGASKATIGWLAAFTMLPRAIASFIGGNVLVRWFKLRTLVVLGFILFGLSTAMLPLVHDLKFLFIDQFAGGLAFGVLMTILMAFCSSTVPAGRKASAMGFFQAVYGVGMVVGPNLVGILAGLSSLQTGFLVVGMISLAAAALAALVI